MVRTIAGATLALGLLALSGASGHARTLAAARLEAAAQPGGLLTVNPAPSGLKHLNPQPLPPSPAARGGLSSLNPQPLPPRWVSPGR